MYKRYLIIFALIIGLFGLTTDSVLAQQTSVKENAAKSKIEREVRKEILSLPYYGVFDAIGFETNGDTITLNGYVTRPLTKEDAGDEVEEVEGVNNVVNNIEVLPLSSSDDRIRVRIYNAIANSGSLYRYLLGTNPSIRIIVNNGRVKLEGFVTYESDKTLAYVAAREIFGVFEVENNLRVEKQGKKVG